MGNVRYQSTGLSGGGFNKGGSACILVFATGQGDVEIVLPTAATAEAVFDVQTILVDTYREAGGSPMAPAGAEAAIPARRVEVLKDAAGDHILRFTLADGTSSAIRLDRRIVADAIKALSAP